MEKEIKGKTAANAKKGGKKIETPVQGSPTWNLLGAMAIGMAVILVFAIGYLVGAKSVLPGSNAAVMNISEELARVTVTGDEDGDWEFSVADGTILEYAGRDSKAVYMTEESEKQADDLGEKATVSADVTADLSDEDYKNASGEASSAEGYRRVYYFRGVNKGETTVTMSYRKNGGITETKAYVVSVDENLKATVKE